jgi:hypothetical protein
MPPHRRPHTAPPGLGPASGSCRRSRSLRPAQISWSASHWDPPEPIGQGVASATIGMVTEGQIRAQAKKAQAETNERLDRLIEQQERTARGRVGARARTTGRCRPRAGRPR